MKDRKIEELPESEREAARQVIKVMQALLSAGSLMPWPEAAVITLVVEKIEESKKNAKKEDELFPF
jgi:hypothetical protein